MAELNFKQITDKLNAEFTGSVRKLIFWYDAEGEFADDVDTLELPNAKVYHLQKDSTFRAKIFLEREDTNSNYLVYAPFAKPDVREDHLADTLRYSKEFFADRASLLMLDLGMGTLGHKVFEPLNKPVIVAAQASNDTVTEDAIELHLERTIKNVGKVEANGKQTTEGFVVLQGSSISPVDDD
ncbi:MAG: hypothetical protein J6A79_11110 [Clostridia bacterium]|nr:hypothetical protein [Clostridia bacterium]